MKKILPFATLAIAAFSIAACGSSGPAQNPRPFKSFSVGETSKNEMGFDIFTTFRVNLYDHGVYECVGTQITFGYGMNLGTTVVTNYGTFIDNGTEDGTTTYTLNKAAESLISSYSLAGGYKININTASASQTYPTELPAKTQGEQTMAQNKQDVLDAYGIGTKLFVNNNIISFDDPNSGERAEVETPSGSVSSVLNKAFKQVQVVSDIKDGANGKDYIVDYLHVFEDNSYKYMNSKLTFGYGMVLGVNTNLAFGKGEYGQGEDGITPFTLSEAEDVALNAYSLAGGFSFAINTASASQTYPTELPAKTQGEKNMAQNKQDVIKEYGTSFTVYTSDENCVMSLKNPNA